MKKTIIILCSLLISVVGYTQKNKKATQILDQVIEKNDSYENMEVAFTLTMENPDAGINESKTGIIFVKGDSFRLNLEGQVVISDGKNQYTLLIEDEEVMINTLEENTDAITPSNLLNSYKENYKSKFVKEKQFKGQLSEVIELVPLKGRTFTKITVIIAKASKQIASFSIHDKNGSMYSYIIDKFTPNAELDPSTFVFNEDDYPDFEIVDMR